MKGLTKFWLVLWVLLSSVISFWYCSDIVHLSRQSVNLNVGATMDFGPGFCLNGSNTNNWITAYYSDNTQATSSFTSYDYYCFNVPGYIKNNGSQQRLAYYYTWVSVGSCSCSTCPDCPTCQENTCIMSVSQHWVIDTFYYTGNWGFAVYLDNDVIYTGYNNPGGSPYIEVSNYCAYTWVESSWDWSALYINDIQHIGAWIINVTIPTEIEWDYIYTWNWDQFDLNVKWYNVDSDYIEGIINTQNSKPNKVDFNNTISGLLPIFVPGLVIILLLYFIFRFIKKIF